MKSFRYLIKSVGLIATTILLTTCVDEVQLPIRQVEPRLVVDGLITDEPPPYSVKLSYSGQFSSRPLLPENLVVNGAVVTIADDAGQSVLLEQDPLNPSYYWVRDTTFRGRPGRAYTLSVQLPDGRVFVSDSERLPPGPSIDNVYAEYRRRNASLGQPDLYDILIDTRDPATPGNYYRWSAYGYVPRWARFDPQNPPPGTLSVCNTCSCWVPYYGPLTNVLSDALINGNNITRRPVLASPIYAVGRQYVEVRQYSLTQEAYQYWNLFEQQRSRTGSLFDAQPAPIEGNIHRADDPNTLALGYFGASSVSQRRLVVQGDTINYNRFINRFGKQFIPANADCFGAYPLAQLAPPLNW